MSQLSPGFQFSQRSLQDYVDCPRRFKLRYLDQLAWPAVESEPLNEHEGHMQAGAAFHLLVQRYLVGVPIDRLEASLASETSPDLSRWWGNFIQFSGITPLQTQLVEATLSTPIGGHRLLAKYDLLRWEGGPDTGLTIYDWKTSRAKPSRQWLEARLQTRIYPYLLVQAGSSILEQGQVEPERVNMVYWFADQPGEPQIFTYSTDRYQADQAYLLELVKEIEGLVDQDFKLTVDEARCRFCTYRSLCDRGVGAGEMDPGEVFEDAGLGDDFELDFDQVAEIEF